jgi:hypothetical protein
MTLVSFNSNTTGATIEQELHTLPEHTSSPMCFDGVRVAQSLVFCVVFCGSLLVLLVIVLSVFWPLYCLSFGHCIVCPFFWPLAPEGYAVPAQWWHPSCYC